MLETNLIKLFEFSANKESNAGTEEPTKEPNNRNTEGGRALQFTSSIEKVKDVSLLTIC